jgi:hypothetical protein
MTLFTVLLINASVLGHDASDLPPSDFRLYELYAPVGGSEWGALVWVSLQESVTLAFNTSSVHRQLHASQPVKSAGF